MEWHENMSKEIQKINIFRSMDKHQDITKCRFMQYFETFFLPHLFCYAKNPFTFSNTICLIKEV